MSANKEKQDLIIGKMFDGILAEDDPKKRKELVEEFQIFSYAISMGFQHSLHSYAYPTTNEDGNSFPA